VGSAGEEEEHGRLWYARALLVHVGVCVWLCGLGPLELLWRWSELPVCGVELCNAMRCARDARVQQFYNFGTGKGVARRVGLIVWWYLGTLVVSRRDRNLEKAERKMQQGLGEL
jgi:hypothetical protein